MHRCHVVIRSVSFAGERVELFMKDGAEPFSQAKTTVMVVDDEHDVREVTATMLRDMGYHVLEASSGPEALELCIQRQCGIDLLLTDLIMPGMTGRMLADALSARCPGLSVIFMSGYVEDFRVDTSEEGIRYLQKPLGERRLAGMISDVLGKRKKQRDSGNK